MKRRTIAGGKSKTIYVHGHLVRLFKLRLIGSQCAPRANVLFWFGMPLRKIDLTIKRCSGSHNNKWNLIHRLQWMRRIPTLTMPIRTSIANYWYLYINKLSAKRWSNVRFVIKRNKCAGIWRKNRWEKMWLK